MKIPSQIQSFKDGTKDSSIKNYSTPMLFEPTPDEKIRVIYWHRWPSYDFIFGYPAKSNRHSKKEVAYFVYRDTRHKKVMCGFYVDAVELEILNGGFRELLKLHRKRRGGKR